MSKLRLHYQALEFKRIESLVRKYAEEKGRPLRILDFGCGHGKFSLLFSELGNAVAAVDINPGYVASMCDKGINSQTTDIFLSQSTEKFDLIFLSHVIEHLSPDQLVSLIPNLCRRLEEDGRLLLISPTHGERFYHDFSHVRPYPPQSIRHAFGQLGAPISYGEENFIEMVDIYFFKDPFRTRLWRSFYVGNAAQRAFTKQVNAIFDFLWIFSRGRIGAHASWLGVYQLAGAKI